MHLVQVVLLSKDFPECRDDTCPHRRNCANHCSAGDFRTEDGSTPDLKETASGNWQCSKDPKAIGMGARLRGGGTVTKIRDRLP